MGRDIAARQMDAVWDGRFFDNLSKELKAEFPDMQGFSVTNLRYCKYFISFIRRIIKLVTRLLMDSSTSCEKNQAVEYQVGIILPQPVGEFAIGCL